MTTIALIAGETSGDQLGGWLMESLRKKFPDAKFVGIGGQNMETQGIKSLFSVHELSVMGFADVLPRALKLKRRIKQTALYLEQQKPDILITIDSFGFTFRLLQLLKDRGNISPLRVHYVAPTVWAYRPERAREIAHRADMLLTMFPCEPPYFIAEGLDTHFIGHEIAWWWREKGDGAAFRKRHAIADTAPLLALFPGSRHGELKRHFPIYKQVVARLAKQVPGMQLVLQVPPHLVEETKTAVRNWAAPSLVLSNKEDKKDLFAAATAALTKSGTICLECALAGLPNVTAFRTNPLSAAIVKSQIKISHINMANILLEREAVPEFPQEKCTPDNLVRALLPLLSDGNARAAQKQDLALVADMLGANEDISPSDKAAGLIAKRISA